MPFSHFRAADSNKYECITRLWKSRVCIRYEREIIGRATDCRSIAVRLPASGTDLSIRFENGFEL